MTKLKLWLKSICNKTQIVTKLKLWQKSNCDKTQNVTTLKLWQNFKTQIVTKLKQSNCDKNLIVIKLKMSRNSNCDKTQKLKLWQNLKYDKSQFIMKKKYLTGSFSKNILTPWQPMICSLGSVLQFSQCFDFGEVKHTQKIPHTGDKPSLDFCG